MKKPLHERLMYVINCVWTMYIYWHNSPVRRGCGALARWGEYWYPIRLIQKTSHDSWRVKWWRYCTFTGTDTGPGTITIVKLCDLVDCLWQDRMERRKIKVRTRIIESETSWSSLYYSAWVLDTSPRHSDIWRHFIQPVTCSIYQWGGRSFATSSNSLENALDWSWEDRSI